MLTEVKFWAQVTGDAKRTVVCPPDLESRVKGWVDARSMGHLIRVNANPACPPDRIFIIDEQAIHASLAESLQRFRPSVWGRGDRRG
jgi:hypothetical protein